MNNKPLLSLLALMALPAAAVPPAATPAVERPNPTKTPQEPKQPMPAPAPVPGEKVEKPMPTDRVEMRGDAGSPMKK